MKRYKFWLFWVVSISFIPLKAVYAWNSFGHKLIAQIAYQNLSPEALIMVSKMNRGFKDVYSQNSFVNAAPWLDKLRYKSDMLQKLHYISLPFSIDNRKTMQPSKVNAVYAINYAAAVISSPVSSNYAKSFNFRILIHVVGDLHQPLHAATQFSNLFPRGDRGGNLVILAPNPIAANLHAFWDNGGGALKTKSRVSARIIKHRAYEIMEHLPCDSQAEILDPMLWAIESHEIAIKHAYPFRPNSKPSKVYTQQVKSISEQRIALAGCRLAELLNKIARSTTFN